MVRNSYANIYGLNSNINKNHKDVNHNSVYLP